MEVFKFDDSFFNAGEPATHVPDGEYLMAIKAAEAEVKTWPDDIRIKWTFTIKDGPAGIGQNLRMTTTLRPDAQFSLRRLLRAIDFDVQPLATVALKKEAEFAPFVEKLAGKIVGQEFGGLVVESKPDDKRRVYSNVNETYPASEYPERSKSNVLPQRLTPSATRNDEEEVEDLAAQVDLW